MRMLSYYELGQKQRDPAARRLMECGSARSMRHKGEAMSLTELLRHVGYIRRRVIVSLAAFRFFRWG